MSTSTRYARGWFSIVALAAIGWGLAACQSDQMPSSQPLGQQWRVVESIGNARIERNDRLHVKGLRPGDRIGENSRVVTGRRAQLIMSRDDMQFTAGSDTTVILHEGSSSKALSHYQGALSVRLTSPINDEQQIVTPHLITSGTSASFDLEVDDQGTNIAMASGQIAISTTDGLYYATLMAGASARFGNQTNGELQISSAAGMPFRPSPRLDAMSVKEDELRQEAMDTLTELRLASRPEALAKLANDVVVLPAKVETRRDAPCGEAPTCRAKGLQMATSKNLAQPSRYANGPEGRDQLQPIAYPAGAEEPSETAATFSKNPGDNRQQFDRLTEGLLDNLPMVQRRFDWNP